MLQLAMATTRTGRNLHPVLYGTYPGMNQLPNSIVQAAHCGSAQLGGGCSNCAAEQLLAGWRQGGGRVAVPPDDRGGANAAAPRSTLQAKEDCAPC